MNTQRNHLATPSAGERVAQLAVAQFLLFDATVESLSVLGERFSRNQPEAEPLAPVGQQMIEPFRSRYALLRRMLQESRPH